MPISIEDKSVLTAATAPVASATMVAQVIMGFSPDEFRLCRQLNLQGGKKFLI